MALQAPLGDLLPEGRVAVARAALPRGNAWMRVVDALGPLHTNPQFADRCPRAAGAGERGPVRGGLARPAGRPGARTGRSGLRCGGAVRLSPAPAGPGGRGAAVRGGADAAARGRAGPGARVATHALAALPARKRLAVVGETWRQARTTVATAAPAWVQGRVPAGWFARYGRRVEAYRLPPARDARPALAVQIGADGRHRLAAGTPGRRDVARGLDPALRRHRPGRAATLVRARYDPPARLAAERGADRTGHTVHPTERGDPALPPLSSAVTTTAAPIADGATLPPSQAHVAARDLLPTAQGLDRG